MDDIVIRLTIAMMDAFKEQAGEEDKNVLFDKYTPIMFSVLSSVSATLAHMWADNVVSNKLSKQDYIKTYGDAIKDLMGSVTKNVFQTYHEKMLELNKTKEELH